MEEKMKKCPICNLPVKNARGVSMHMSMKHKTEWATGAYHMKNVRKRNQMKASRLISKWAAEDAKNPSVSEKRVATSKEWTEGDTKHHHMEVVLSSPESVVNRTLLTVIHTLLKGYEL